MNEEMKYRQSVLLTFLISSKVCTSGERPPWTHKNCWFIKAARGRQSNASIQASYTRSVYLILPKLEKDIINFKKRMLIKCA